MWKTPPSNPQKNNLTHLPNLIQTKIYSFRDIADPLLREDHLNIAFTSIINYAEHLLFDMDMHSQSQPLINLLKLHHHESIAIAQSIKKLTALKDIQIEKLQKTTTDVPPPEKPIRHTSKRALGGVSISQIRGIDKVEITSLQRVDVGVDTEFDNPFFDGRKKKSTDSDQQEHSPRVQIQSAASYLLSLQAYINTRHPYESVQQKPNSKSDYESIMEFYQKLQSQLALMADIASEGESIPISKLQNKHLWQDIRKQMQLAKEQTLVRLMQCIRTRMGQQDDDMSPKTVFGLRDVKKKGTGCQTILSGEKVDLVLKKQTDLTRKNQQITIEVMGLRKKQKRTERTLEENKNQIKILSSKRNALTNQNEALKKQNKLLKKQLLILQNDLKNLMQEGKYDSNKGGFNRKRNTFQMLESLKAERQSFDPSSLQQKPLKIHSCTVELSVRPQVELSETLKRYKQKSDGKERRRSILVNKQQTTRMSMLSKLGLDHQNLEENNFSESSSSQTQIQQKPKQKQGNTTQHSLKDSNNIIEECTLKPVGTMTKHITKKQSTSSSQRMSRDVSRDIKKNSLNKGYVSNNIATNNRVSKKSVIVSVRPKISMSVMPQKTDPIQPKARKQINQSIESTNQPMLNTEISQIEQRCVNESVTDTHPTFDQFLNARLNTNTDEGNSYMDSNIIQNQQETQIQPQYSTEKEPEEKVMIDETQIKQVSETSEAQQPPQIVSKQNYQRINQQPSETIIQTGADTRRSLNMFRMQSLVIYNQTPKQKRIVSTKKINTSDYGDKENKQVQISHILEHLSEPSHCLTQDQEKITRWQEAEANKNKLPPVVTSLNKQNPKAALLNLYKKNQTSFYRSIVDQKTKNKTHSSLQSTQDATNSLSSIGYCPSIHQNMKQHTQEEQRDNANNTMTTENSQKFIRYKHLEDLSKFNRGNNYPAVQFENYSKSKQTNNIIEEDTFIVEFVKQNPELKSQYQYFLKTISNQNSKFHKHNITQPELKSNKTINKKHKIKQFTEYFKEVHVEKCGEYCIHLQRFLQKLTAVKDGKRISLKLPQHTFGKSCQ